MANDRVHPHDSPQQPSLSQHDDDEEVSTPRPSPPSPEKPVPPPPPAGTYVIQIPKDQIYRVPPPENAARYKHLSGRSKRSRTCRCCRCFCFTLLIFIILLAIAAGVFYLVVRPEAPKYTVDSVSIKGLNLTAASSSASSPLSPEFNITITADNPNDKIGIYYDKDSSVVVYYKDINLGGGVLPSFFQPSNNFTVFHTLLKGSAVELASAVRSELASAERSGTVPLKVKVRVPVKIKVGSVKTWTIKVKVNCDLTVDKVTAQSKIVSKDCDYGVNLW